MLKLILSIVLCGGFFLTTAQSNVDTSQANQLFQKGLQQQQQRAFVAANLSFEKAATIFEKATYSKGYIDCQNQIARDYWKMHELDSSLMVSIALEKYPALEKQSLQHAELLSNIGVVYDLQSNYDMALKYFHQCLDIRKEKLGLDHFETGKIYYNIGLCYNLQRKKNTAIEYFENTARNFKKNLGPEHPYLITVYQGMRDAYEDLGKSQEAINVLQKSLLIAKKIYPPKHLQIGRIIGNLGVTYSNMKGLEKKGLKMILESAKISLKSYDANSSKMILIYNNIGLAYYRCEQYTLAKKYLFKGLEIAKKSIGEKHIRNHYLYTDLALTFSSEKDEQTALRYSHQAMLALLPGYSGNFPIDSIPAFDDTPIITPVLLAKAYHRKVLKTQQLYQENPSERHQILYKRHLQAMDVLLARLRQEISNVDDLTIIFRQGYQTTLYKTHFYKTLDPQKGQQALLEELIEDADRNKSVLLKLALRSNDALEFGGVSDSLIQSKIAFRKDISKTEQQLYRAKEVHDSSKTQTLSTALFKLKQAQEQFNTNLEKEHPQYCRLQYDNKYPNVKKIQAQILDDSTMLIEYMQSGSFLYVFSVTKTSVDVDFFKLDEDFSKRIKAFRSALTNIQFIKTQPIKSFSAFSDHA